MKAKGILIALLVWAVLMVAVVVPVAWPAVAAPEAPVMVESGVPAAPLPRSIVVNDDPIAASTNFDPIQVQRGYDRWETIDVFWDVDETTVNTVTLKLQISPDASIWVDHALAGTLATMATDTEGYTTTVAHGLYMRVVATLANTNTVTPTIKVVLR